MGWSSRIMSTGGRRRSWRIKVGGYERYGSSDLENFDKPASDAFSRFGECDGKDTLVLEAANFTVVVEANQ
ncbi:unnamed protein product [Sphagnum tenellum]